MEHLKTPWSLRIDHSTLAGCYPKTLIVDLNSNFVANFFTQCKTKEEAEAKAEFAVKAVNSYGKNQQTIKACEALINCVSENPDDYIDPDYYRQVMDKMEQASKAILKAKE